MRLTISIALFTVVLGGITSGAYGRASVVKASSEAMIASADSTPPVEIINSLIRKSVFPLFQRHTSTSDFALGHFSRCPSGYGFVLKLQTGDKNLEFGVAQLSTGCVTRTLAEFKIDLALGVVYLHDEGATEWLSLEEYELRKFGKAS